MDGLYTRFDNVFFEKTRLSIMTIVFREERVAFNSLKKELQLTDGALYTHIEKLVSAGYLAKERQIAGTSVQTVYFLSREGDDAFRDYLGFLEHQLKLNSGRNQ